MNENSVKHAVAIEINILYIYMDYVRFLWLLAFKS